MNAKILMTQADASTEAKRLNHANRPTGMVWIAVEVPGGPWDEQGWAVRLYTLSSKSRNRRI